jgi:hypothetical protein
VNVRHHTGSEKNQTPVLGLIRKIPSIHEGQRTCDTDRKCNVIYYNPAATLLSVKACWLSHDVQNRSREMLSFFLSFQNMYSELVTVSKQSIKLSRTQCKPTLLHCYCTCGKMSCGIDMTTQTTVLVLTLWQHTCSLCFVCV